MMSEGPASVLRLITRLNIGGPAIQALALTEKLQNSFPTVLGAGASPENEGEMPHGQVDVRRLSLVRPVSPLMDTKAFFEVRGLIAEVRPRILHTHMAKAGTIGRLAVARHHPAIKTVHTFHGHVLDAYFAKPIEGAFLRLERLLASRTDVLIAVSPEVRDSLLDKGIGSPARFRVIPLGFDLGPFLAIQRPSGYLRPVLGLPSDIRLVGVVGRLAAVKDHATLFRAMALLAGTHLAVFGDGEERGHLVALAKELRFSDRVHFLGWRLDMAHCLSDLDVIALTSRNEGTPVSLIEASACARPVISTDVGGVRSVVIDGVTGYLVPRSDPRAVAKAIRSVLEDPQKATRMGLAGREYVRDRFAQQRLIADVSSLYEELIGSRA